MLCFPAHSDSDGCRGCSCPWRRIPAAGGWRGCSLSPARQLGTCWPSPTSPGATAPGRLSQAGTRATLTPKSPKTPEWCQSPHLPMPSSSPEHFSRDLSQIFLAVVHTHDLLPLPKGPSAGLSLQSFAHLEPSDVFSLSLAFLSQNPPPFLTLSPSLVFPAQLPRAEQRVPALPVLLRGCLSLLELSVPPASLFLLCCCGCLSLSP